MRDFESLPLPALVFTYIQRLLIILHMDVQNYPSLDLLKDAFNGAIREH
jgi:hypothetical protein